MNDITKLPQWAQREIERLRADVTSANQHLASALGTAPTAIEVDPSRIYRGSDMPRLYLPESYAVRFSLSGGTVDVGIKNDELTICGQADFSSFIVLPQMSNVIAVRFERPER